MALSIELNRRALGVAIWFIEQNRVRACRAEGRVNFSILCAQVCMTRPSLSTCVRMGEQLAPMLGPGPWVAQFRSSAYSALAPIGRVRANADATFRAGS